MESPSSASALSSLSPVARKPLYERLVEHLRAYVVEARLSAGDRLPSERELSERLGVSRASVRQAIVALEVQGILEVKHGEGTFLRTARMDTLPIAQLADLKRRLPDILDAREAIEVKLAELAAERRTKSDLAAIDAALKKMEHEIEHGTTGEQGDHDFHQSVVRAARSELLARMYALILKDIELSSHETADQIGTPTTLLEQDRRIGDAIRAGEGPAAATAMRDHLKTTAHLKMRAWSPLPD
jgi:GntR family transcriptional regulator, transcriptional repressor for pyruvate dehydrogenase complex